MKAGHIQCSNVKRMKVARGTNRWQRFRRLAEEICLEPGNAGVNTDASQLGRVALAVWAGSATNENIMRTRSGIDGWLRSGAMPAATPNIFHISPDRGRQHDCGGPRRCQISLP
jgi:hypothetical protein